MSFATDKWFQHLREQLLVEGLVDIGLTSDIVVAIRAKMPDASEKGRMWVGMAFKEAAVLHEVREKFVKSGLKLMKQHNLMKDLEPRKEQLIMNLFSATAEEQINKVLKARKRFFKQAPKVIPDQMDFAEQFVELVDEAIMGAFERFASRIENTIITLNQNPNNYEMIKEVPPEDWSQAEEICYEFQQEQEDPEQIIHTFEDGSFWYDLQSSSCEIEAARMGHCGSDHRGGMYSLRKRDKKQKVSKSYVTIAYNPYDKTIYQIKGRANSCPPEIFWGHIEKFIELTGAETLEEYGQYSNDEDAFDKMGIHLAEKTGISFAGNRLNDFRERIEELESRFRLLSFHRQCDYEDAQVYRDDDETGRPFWSSDYPDIFVVEVPFALTEKLVNAFDEETEMREGTDLNNDILKIFQHKDANGIFSTRYADDPEFLFITAKNEMSAMQRAQNRTNERVQSTFLQGKRNYLVMENTADAINDWVADNLDSFNAEDFDDYLTAIGTIISDLEGSVDKIEAMLMEKGLIDPPAIATYADRVEEEFNNFNVMKLQRGFYNMTATGNLFEFPQSEAQQLNNIEFFSRPALLKTGDGFYTSRKFRGLFLRELDKAEDKAIDFAKRQMQLNFGDKYKKEREDLLEKAAKEMWDTETTKIGLYRRLPEGNKPTDYHGLDYYLVVNLTEKTLPVLGPLLEYYDNNFDIVINAFKNATRQLIQFAEEEHNKEPEPDFFGLIEEARTNPLDVRLYEIDFVMSYPLGKGFEMTDIHNIVRAIPDVTTVRTVGETKRTQANRTVSLQRLKFALQGQTPRNEWVKQVLLPQIHKISTDIRIHKVDRADLVSNSKQRLEETYAAFSQRPSAPRTTPRPTIQGLIDDWVEGGVMYDQPTNINLTRYSVMMPVADLEHLCGREPRKHGHHFDAGYENFIKNGPRDPIYLAIGKNGRAKITGNEDDLRYAIKAGVEEVPVFISYQRQV